MKKLTLTFLVILLTLTSNVAWSNYGFKDLRPDMTLDDYKRFCPKVSFCYGLTDIRFIPSTSKNSNGKRVLTLLTLDMGPITTDTET